MIQILIITMIVIVIMIIIITVIYYKSDSKHFVDDGCLILGFS